MSPTQYYSEIISIMLEERSLPVSALNGPPMMVQPLLRMVYPDITYSYFAMPSFQRYTQTIPAMLSVYVTPASVRLFDEVLMLLE